MNELWRQALMTGGLVLVTTVICGVFGLPLLRYLNVGQQVRDDGPQTHLKKSGTPTFGGLFFLCPLLVAAISLPVVDRELVRASAVIVLMLLFAVVGFLDDYIKVRVNRKGLSVRQKTLLLGAFSLIFTVWYLWLAPSEPFLLVPFTDICLQIQGVWKFIYAIFIVLYLFFVSNAVNLADGLDGLCAGLSAICALFFAVMGVLVQRVIPAGHSAAVVGVAIAGGCLGFLVFNRHPAMVFMGDTGSQALGADLFITLLFGAPWLMLFTGLVFVVEGMSSILQVLYFRRTGGKRLFLMAPLHHHFEALGWPEKRVVYVFWFAAVLCGFAGLLPMIPIM